MAMTKAERAARDENIRAINKAFPELTEEQATTLQDKLHNIAVRITRAEELACSEPGFEEHRSQVREKARKDIPKLMAKFGINCPFTLCTDVRGPGLWLHLPTNSYNTFGGAECGWGIL